MSRGMSLSVRRSRRYPERPSAFGVREVCGRTLRAKEGDLRAAGRDKPLARRTPNKMRVPGVAAPRKSANRRRRDHSMLAMSGVPARFRLLPVVSTPAVVGACATGAEPCGIEPVDCGASVAGRGDASSAVGWERVDAATVRATSAAMVTIFFIYSSVSAYIQA